MSGELVLTGEAAGGFLIEGYEEFAAEEVVRALSAHGGGTLRLGLVGLSKRSARLLTGRASPLAIPALETLAEDAADVLSTYGGPLSVNESLLSSSCDLYQHPRTS